MDPLNTGFLESNGNNSQNTEMTSSIPSIKYNISIKISRAIVLEKKPNSKSKTIPLLKFPQLSVCYRFNYSNYDFTSKKIIYSH